MKRLTYQQAGPLLEVRSFGGQEFFLHERPQVHALQVQSKPLRARAELGWTLRLGDIDEGNENIQDVAREILVDL